MSSDVKVAFVGAGYMTTEHLKAFSSLPGVTPAGIFSRSLDRAAALAGPSNAQVCTSIAQLYEQTGAGIIVVSVPELSMAEVAIQCFQFPWMVILEKPAGYNLSDAQRILDAARAANSRAFVAFNRRAYSSTRDALAEVEGSGPRFIKIQDQQDQGAAIRDHGQPQRVADNYMFANSIHVIDYMRVFGRGTITKVNNILPWNPSKPGVVLAEIEFSSGDVALYEGIWDGPGPWSVSVSTPERRVEMRPLEQGQVQLRGTRVQTALPLYSDDVNFKPGLRRQAFEALAALRGHPSRLATLEDSFASMKLVADIFGMHG